MIDHLKLSYDLEANNPVYPRTPESKIRRIKKIEKGDSCNTYFISCSNHSGTHIDAPRHFFKDGRAICDFKLQDLIFHDPLVIDCPSVKNGCIDVTQLNKRIMAFRADIILIRTGFSKYRKTNPRMYCNNGPFISANAAHWLRDSFPSLRAVGIDFISVASPAARDAGRETHRIFLKEESREKKTVLLIEDMYIPPKIKTIGQIMVVPFFVKGIDSAPCTVIGITK
jgi:arylformamidase